MPSIYIMNSRGFSSF